MFGSRRMLQTGELPRDLLERQDAPEVAALAHIGPPARGLPTCSSWSARPSRFPHGLWRGLGAGGLAPALACVSALPAP